MRLSARTHIHTETREEKSLSKSGPFFPGSGHNRGESSSSRHPWGVGVSARTSQSLSDNQRRKRRAKMKRAPPLAHPRSEKEESCSTTAHGRHRRRRRISEGENRGSLNGWVAAVSNATTQEDLHYHEEASSHPRLQRGEEMDVSVSRDGERRADTVPPTPQGISAGQQTRLTRRRRRGNRGGFLHGGNGNPLWLLLPSLLLAVTPMCLASITSSRPDTVLCPLSEYIDDNDETVREFFECPGLEDPPNHRMCCEEKCCPLVDSVLQVRAVAYLTQFSLFFKLFFYDCSC